MTAVDLPAPLVVLRHQCPFCCRYTRADPARVTWHMGRCLRNPAARNCGTCAHHQDEERGGTCFPGQQCRCNEIDEGCTHPDGPTAGYRFPIQNCPLWHSKEEAA